MLSQKYLWFMAFICLMIAGCSGGSKDNPVLPADDAVYGETSLEIPESIASGSTIPMLFGMYEVELNRGDLTGNIHPMRVSSVLGDSFDVDITPFLSVSPCADCIRIKSIALSPDGYVEVTFQTKHPFQPDTRYDLHVFDMRGIIVTGDNTLQFERIRMDLDGNGSTETPARGNVSFLVNADGYTSFYDDVVEGFTNELFDSTICPFKNMWMNPATNPPDSNYNPATASRNGFTDLTKPVGHNVFPMGGNFDNPLSQTTYQFNFSETDNIEFILILEASYGHTTIRATRKDPRYFLPEFHRKDAWNVKAEVLENNLIAGSSTSAATVQVSVMDWQAGVAPTSGWSYQTSNLTETKYMSDVRQVLFDVPGILNAARTYDLSNLESGTGTYDDPYIWSIEFQNEKAAKEGDYFGLIAIRDDLAGSPNAPYGVSGASQNPVKVSDLTTYQAFAVNIMFVNLAPLADVDVDPNPVRVCKDVTISVGPNCYDPDGIIIRYEYDFTYDGTTFDPDEVQNQGDPDFGWDVSTQFGESEFGNHTIAQRVTDDQDVSSIDSVILQVQPNQVPVSNLINSDSDNTVTVCDEIDFQPGTLCVDPDGIITKYEYDFDYNGTNFVADEVQNDGDPDFGDPVTWQFENTGSGSIQYTVALRVTDDGCPVLTDIDTNVMTVTVFTGQIMFENFETTTSGGVPTGWGVTGHTGGAYYLTSGGDGCTDTQWKWGVTDNSSLCEGGEAKFLNESGYNHAGSDPLDTYQNRAHIVYSPEFYVPPDGATVTVRHNFDMLYGILSTTTHYLDGGRVILSVDNPGTITWEDFCNYGTSPGWDNNPIRPLNVTGGPALRNISLWAAETHPLSGMMAHAGSSGGWVTSTYYIPATYACEKVRLGFLFGSDDLLATYYGGIGPPEYNTNCSQYLNPPPPSFVSFYPSFGWRINWMEITAN
jgi:hypothetical protein